MYIGRKQTHSTDVSYAIVISVKDGHYWDFASGLDADRVISEFDSFLTNYGFELSQTIGAGRSFGRAIFFGGPNVTATICVLAIQAACYKFSWFLPEIWDATMLRIDERTDLMRATWGDPSFEITEI